MRNAELVRERAKPEWTSGGPGDGYPVSPLGRPTHPSALSHAGIANEVRVSTLVNSDYGEQTTRLPSKA